jgi:hypothetical protein
MRTSFFRPRHLGKEDDALWIEDATNDLIVLSESTVREADVGEYLAIAVKAADTFQTPASSIRCSSLFCKSGSSVSSPQCILISDSTAPPPPSVDNAHDGSTSNSIVRKGKTVVQGVLPKGTSSDPVHVSDSDLSAPTYTRRGGKKKGRKPKGGKRSASITNRKWQDSWATAFPWAEKYHKEDGLVLSVKCLVCTRILGRPKTLSLKRDNLNKHAG